MGDSLEVVVGGYDVEEAFFGGVGADADHDLDFLDAELELGEG